MDDPTVFFDIQRIIMGTKNRLRFMKDPVDPESIVETVQLCFGELATQVPKIGSMQLRRKFRRRVKAVATATDTAISDAVDGTWHCNIQVILDTLGDIVDLIVPSESSDDEDEELTRAKDPTPVEDEFGFMYTEKKPVTRTKLVRVVVDPGEEYAAAVREAQALQAVADAAEKELYKLPDEVEKNVPIREFGYIDKRAENTKQNAAFGYTGRIRTDRLM
jgi:hypothetical protein